MKYISFENITVKIKGGLNLKKSCYKKLCILLSLVMLLSCGGIPTVAVYAATDIADGYTGYADSGDVSVSLFDFNSVGSFVSLGLPPSASNTRDGNRYSIHWNNHVQNFDLYIYPSAENTDWTGYNAVDTWIYSEKATNATVMFLAMSPQSASGAQYFWQKFTINWTGWKHIVFNLDELNINREPSYDNITTVRFCSGYGWNLVADPESDLYIGSLSLKKINRLDFVNNFYTSEVVDETLGALDGSAAVYGGGSNVVTSDGAEPADYTAGWQNGAVTLPLDFYENYFGATVKSDESGYSITLGDNVISGVTGEKSALVNSISAELDIAPYVEDGHVYVPGAQVASLLGLKTVSDNKLLVVGRDDTIDKFKRTQNLGVNESSEIASYYAYHDEFDISKFRIEDCTAVKNNWIATEVGNEATNDITDPDIAAEVSSIVSNARKYWGLFDKTVAKGELFTDLASTASADITTAYDYLLNMAKGYACYGGELYHNTDLLSDIKFGLEWLYANRYNPDIYSKTSSASWTVTGFNNWWDWQIGVPHNLIPVLMMIEEHLTADEINKYLLLFDQLVPSPRMTGANFTDLAYAVTGSALLKNDIEKVVEVQTAITKMFLYVDDNVRFAESLLFGDRANTTPIKGAGFFTDGSYIIHTLHPHLGSYGQVQLGCFADFMELYAGTALEMQVPFVENIYHIFKTSYESAIYDGKMFRWTYGRNPERNVTEVNIHAYLLRMADIFDDEIKNDIYASVKKLGASEYNRIVAALPIAHIKKFKDLMSDDTVLPNDAILHNRMFYNSDKMVHHRDGWGAAIAMSSSRIFNYESINDANPDGWYLSDGRTEYFLEGTDINATDKYYVGMDKYRLPGTTVDTQTRKKASINQGNEYLSSKDFVGGVSLGDYGVAAMELESYHNATDYGSAGPAPAHQSDLTAKKAYFMLDDEIVCLGAAVNAKDNNNAEVLTIVENRLCENSELASGEVAELAEPYEIVSAVANLTPEAENIAENTIDDSYVTKYAGEVSAELVWDLGSEKLLGFIDLSFTKGSTRKQYFKLAVSSDGAHWKEVFDGESSGLKETNEYFDLGNVNARYVKFINLGNSTNSPWVSLTNCDIYPPNDDGSVGLAEVEIYGSDTVVADGAQMKIYGDATDISDITWMNVGDNCGYVFPKENTENLGVLKARWTKSASSYFEIWFSHGVNPTNGAYSYVLLPGKTSEETRQYAESSNIEILANSDNVQAVRDNGLGITGIIFWKAGAFGDITVSKPCIVICREHGSEYEIAVSDPTQKLTSLSLTVGRILAPVDTDDCATVSSANSSTAINYDMKNSAGRSMKCIFTSEGAAAS